MSITAPVYRAKIWFVDSFCFLKRLPPSAEIKVPYFSQFMSAELVEDFIEGKRELNTDPKWRRSGAGSPEEYVRWTWNVCGITCFKMIVSAKDSSASAPQLVALAKEATEYDAFKVTETSISPLHYAEFCAFVREKYSMPARPVSALSICNLKEHVTKGDFVIASVHPSIRHATSIPPKRGGHLVLIVGYDENGVYIHNPSGYQSNSSQKRAFVSYKDFKRFFAYRGIVISNN